MTSTLSNPVPAQPEGRTPVPRSVGEAVVDLAGLLAILLTALAAIAMCGPTAGFLLGPMNTTMAKILKVWLRR
ncbi:hypothetical protein ABIA39_007466 [Nocardia sp. GAS34]|uniref:hypothetical protein n=1 Tax=unclassified Nocardia TaxID=2637762 RepID=UPI003D250CBA